MTTSTTAAPAALAGIRVVYLAALGPIPFATMLLSDLGADVVRIDRPGAVGVSGLLPEDDPRTRGQRSVGIDLKQPAGIELAQALIGSGDVFLEGMRPGVAERMGLGPDELTGRNPRLVYGRMTGWGQSGPRSQQAGHDINYLSVAGALHPIGWADRPPAVPLNLVADFGGGGTYLAMGVMAALLQRATTGAGQVIDCAMVDGVASLTALFHGLLAKQQWTDDRQANLFDGGAPFYRTYATADGGAMAVGALEPQFYAELLTRLDLPAEEWPQHDRARWPDQAARLGELFMSRTRAEWTQVFAGSDACVTPVLSLSEATYDPQMSARHTFVDWDGLTQPAPAPRLSGSATGPRPRAGYHAHSHEVLAEIGCSADRIDELLAAKVVE